MCVICALSHLVYVRYIMYYITINREQTTRAQSREKERKKDMALAGSMTISIYDSEIRNIYHDLGYWIINLCYWYPDAKYTREQAIEAFKNKDK